MITPAEWAALLPPTARADHFGRHAARAEWTTDSGTWTIAASWPTHGTTRITIRGPHASTTLTDPTTDLVHASLALLGAIPDPPLTIALTNFCTRYTAAWFDGDNSEQCAALDALHNSLQAAEAWPT